MHSKAYHISSDIKLSSSDEIFYHTNVLIGYHLLIWTIAGQTRVEQSGTSTTFDAGTTFILPHNQVIRLVDIPTDGIQFKALTIRLSEKKIKSFSSHLHLAPSFLTMDSKPFELKSDVKLYNTFKSIIDVYDKRLKLGEQATEVKLLELLGSLRATSPKIDNILGSFESIRKLDITKFMEGHFMFNIPIEQFSYLTGRSVSAFNRDFRKTFGMPPQKWLTKKRLVLAHHKMTVFMKKPIDIYREVGFENLSHFSFAFKKEYGYPPKDAITLTKILKINSPHSSKKNR